jgi:sec-independent protein translocase protein TatA
MNSFLLLFGIGGLGPTELVIILVILLLVFGGTKLPQLAKGLGEGVRNFKRAVADDDEEKRNDKTKVA